jgi:dihydrofolate reductase
MGAATYRAMATIVGSADDPGSARMNDLPKVVFSRTLEPPLTWSNTTLVSLDLASAVPAMKAEDGDPLRLIGSLSVLRSLLRLGLVDRLRLLLFPQLLAATGDESVFENLSVDVDLRLESTRVLDGRLVLLEYQPLPAVSAH